MVSWTRVLGVLLLPLPSGALSWGDEARVSIAHDELDANKVR